LAGLPVVTTVPVPVLIVLQPKPTPGFQIKAFRVPLHAGMGSPDGVVAVAAPRTVLAT